ncbi:protein FAM107B isoform X1 [Syngnathus scovelli]|uniref:protein FAM107B isoform X1 n=1 Tax=Syngnathus scovelli TaxID=161590 RepID=UPI00210F6B36|nr:protein FAM107B isoform X1 [Syngnathus scovelli]
MRCEESDNKGDVRRWNCFVLCFAQWTKKKTAPKETRFTRYTMEELGESDANKKGGYGHHQKDTSLSLCAVDGSGDTQPRKLNGSSVEAPSYQNLHRELLLSHKRGLVLEEKPELKRVLEQRRLELHREQEMAQQRPSDLETELRKRQQKLQEYEQEEIRQKENQNKVPEFVRVKDNLRRTQMFMQ